jgi:hypothetical protein
MQVLKMDKNKNTFYIVVDAEDFDNDSLEAIDNGTIYKNCESIDSDVFEDMDSVVLKCEAISKVKSVKVVTREEPV